MVDTRLLREVAAASPSDALALLKTTPHGLTEAEAAVRIRQYGRNEVAHEKPSPWYVELAKAFYTPFNALLFVLVCISYVTDVRLLVLGDHSAAPLRRAVRR
jgi:Mg2+-importing ATPase